MVPKVYGEGSEDKRRLQGETKGDQRFLGDRPGLPSITSHVSTSPTQESTSLSLEHPLVTDPGSYLSQYPLFRTVLFPFMQHLLTHSSDLLFLLSPLTSAPATLGASPSHLFSRPHSLSFPICENNPGHSTHH